jgi:hypothetical protein
MVNPASPLVSVSVWDGKSLSSEEAENCYAHLDIGSSNYGPISFNQHECYTHSSLDPEGKRIHRVLFETVNHYINVKKDGFKEFIFYLVDIDKEGLDAASEKLKKHLIVSLEELKLPIEIRIITIARDIFKIQEFPRVNSATFIHPSGSIARPVFMFSEAMISQKTQQPIKPFTKEATPKDQENLSQILDFLLKINGVSKTGILIKEVNIVGGIADLIAERFQDGILIQHGTLGEGLLFRAVLSREIEWKIPPYVLPNGEAHMDYPFPVYTVTMPNYAITLETLFSNLET